MTSFPKTGKTLQNTLIKPTLSLFNNQNFVTERKIDEELARTTRFVGDKDELKSMIANFGEGKFETKMNITPTLYQNFVFFTRKWAVCIKPSG